jgi:methylated-DNA-[protein]-cysteine S-methyltransferase
MIHFRTIDSPIGPLALAGQGGLPNGRNPIAIVVPCHRVIGASGSLTGYGGGPNRKRWLLDVERSRTCATPSLFD